MEFKQIKQIVDLMKRSGLTEFQLEEDAFKLRIKRGNGEVQTVYQAATPPPFPVGPIPGHPNPVAPPASSGAPGSGGTAPAESEVDESKLIKSPMVGTFYAAPSPDSPPFVQVGDPVNEDSVVCIVEAMKVMNEIKAECKGTIAEVLIENGDSVEYGQPLFRLK